MLGYKDIGLKYKDLWLFVGLCMVAFVVYSSLTSSPVTVDFKFSDKFLHIVGYFALMAWFIQIYHKKKSRIILTIIFVAMGIGLEFLQDFGGIRYFEVADMVANTAGVLLAWSLAVTPLQNILYGIESLLLRNKQ